MKKTRRKIHQHRKRKSTVSVTVYTRKIKNWKSKKNDFKLSQKKMKQNMLKEKLKTYNNTIHRKNG